MKDLKGFFPEGMFTPFFGGLFFFWGEGRGQKFEIYYKYIMWGIKLKGFMRQVDLSYSQGYDDTGKDGNNMDDKDNMDDMNDKDNLL